MGQNILEELYTSARSQIVVSDPSIIMSSLGIEYKSQNNGNRYVFRARPEDNNASAYISLLNGQWRYNDFGDNSKGSKGSIIDVVMKISDLDFNDAMDYCLSQLGLDDIKEKMEMVKKGKLSNPEMIERSIDMARKRNELIAKSNREKEQSSGVVTKVKSSYPVSTNTAAQEYLKSRGIVKIPEEMLVISGEYEKDGKVHKRFGVGVLTESEGADIHFLKKMGSLKGMMLGKSDISYFQRTKTPKTSPIVIYESKMDYASSYQFMDLKDINVIISNSVSNYKKVLELIEDKGLEGQVYFMNQNDIAGYNFVHQVASGLGVKDSESIKMIWYDLVNEYKKDINDLQMDGVNPKQRFFNNPLHKVKEAEVFLKKYKDDLEEVVSNPDIHFIRTRKGSKKELIEIYDALQEVNLELQEYKFEISVSETSELYGYRSEDSSVAEDHKDYGKTIYTLSVKGMDGEIFKSETCSPLDRVGQIRDMIFEEIESKRSLPSDEVKKPTSSTVEPQKKSDASPKP